MAKKRRVTTATRSSTQKPAAKAKAGARERRPSPRPEAPASAAPDPPPTQAARRPAYYEAIALYESGVRALQKHEFPQAAAQFKAVLDRFPEERELHERARLYLRVCERETARRPAGPQTPEERVYAATMALNAGDPAQALDHLQRALEQAPDNDHAHYMTAVALATRGERADALEHLRRAVALNPDNRALARQDPDLEPLRSSAGFEEAIESAPSAPRRPRPRGSR